MGCEVVLRSPNGLLHVFVLVISRSYCIFFRVALVFGVGVADGVLVEDTWGLLYCDELAIFLSMAVLGRLDELFGCQWTR